MSERIKHVVGARVLVERDRTEGVTASGLTLPEQSRQFLNTGRVRFAGEASVYHPDDRILFYPGEGLDIEVPGIGTLWLVTDEAIVAVLEPVPE